MDFEIAESENDLYGKEVFGISESPKKNFILGSEIPIAKPDKSLPNSSRVIEKIAVEKGLLKKAESVKKVRKKQIVFTKEKNTFLIEAIVFFGALAAIKLRRK